MRILEPRVLTPFSPQATPPPLPFAIDPVTGVLSVSAELDFEQPLLPSLLLPSPAGHVAEEVDGLPSEEDITRVYSALVKMPHPLPRWAFFKERWCVCRIGLFKCLLSGDY